MFDDFLKGRFFFLILCLGPGSRPGTLNPDPGLGPGPGPVPGSRTLGLGARVPDPSRILDSGRVIIGGWVGEEMVYQPNQRSWYSHSSQPPRREPSKGGVVASTEPHPLEILMNDEEATMPVKEVAFCAMDS